MVIRVSLVLLMVVCVCTHLYAQKKNKPDYDKLYADGKQKFILTQYTEAVKCFSEIVKSEPPTSYNPSAYYFLALSYYNDSLYKDANFILFQLIQKYPEWSKLDYALYLKGICQMELKNYFDAMIQWTKVQLPACKDITYHTKKYYLKKITTDTLQILLRRFPNEKAITSELNSRIGTPTSLMNVAIMLPFEAGIQSNQDMFDFYSGIALAADSLTKEGIKFNINLIETKFDTVLINKFIADSLNTKNYDLIIGPIYQAQQMTMKNFADKYSIKILNPLTTTQLNSKNYSIMMPLPNIRGSKAAEYCLQTFPKKTSLIFYGKTTADTLCAKSFRSVFEAAGGCIQAYRCLDKISASWLPKIIEPIYLDSVGCIFVSSKEQVLAANVFSALEAALLQKTAVYKETAIKKETEDKTEKIIPEKKISASDVPLIVPMEWLYFNAINYEQYVLHNTHFLYPFFVNKNTPFAKKFETIYTDSTGIPPGYYSYIGYEAMFYGLKYTNANMNPIHNIPLPFTEYIYNDTIAGNNYVPIVKLQDYKLILTNPNDPAKNK
ncbi:MAG: outer membrane protein assembly factor BamD [Cytophagales bacterium]|nr:outer membrane protein assembly factor BamD [Cytophagales bacterium]